MTVKEEPPSSEYHGISNGAVAGGPSSPAKMFVNCAKKDLFIIHAGTKENNGNFFSSGGRVLNVVSKGKNFNQIRNT